MVITYSLSQFGCLFDRVLSFLLFSALFLALTRLRLTWYVPCPSLESAIFPLVPFSGERCLGTTDGVPGVLGVLEWLSPTAEPRS